MAKLFVFGIGGTGARVIKSLTMLLASGIKTNFEIVPILIDPDSAGGDLNRTIRLLKDYQSIQKEVDGYEQNTFFKNKLSTLGEIASDNADNAKIYSGFRFDIEGTQNDTFKDFIDFNSLDAGNKNLIRLLFSEKNLASDLQVGFKGNPNIGSVVLNQFTNSEVFQAFADSVQEDDRIFIVSSIFGGTGAAGFPLLLKNIRQGNVNGKHYKNLQNAKVGGLTVLPYFKVQHDEESQIDSHGFITKTKAALNYYCRNISGNHSINALYYIGDTAENTYSNVEGGTKQKNDAHFIEIASALSVIDFATIQDDKLRTNKDGTVSNTIYKEFGIEKADSPIAFESFYKKTKNLIAHEMTFYFYFALFLKENLGNSLDFPFAKTNTHTFDEGFLQQDFYRTLEDFNREYRVWMAELAENQIAFSPFDIKASKNADMEIDDFEIENENIFDLVRGYTPKKGGLLAKKNYNLFVHHLNKTPNQETEASNTAKRFMGVFSQGIQDLIKQKIFQA